MKIKTLFMAIFCAGLVLTLVLYLCHLYGNYIEKTQEPITGYTYNGFEENLKSATLLKSQSVAAQTAKNAIFLVWTDFLPCVG